MPETDLDLLIRVARLAGDIATSFNGPDARRWEKSGGAGPVTEADLAVNEMLVNELLVARPDYGWLSEESEDDGARLNRDTVFIVDPIDGTRSFMEGSRTWAHALAIVHKRIVTAAVVYLPMHDKLYSAAAGSGAYLNNEPINATQRRDISGSSMLAAKPSYAPENWRGDVPDVTRVYRPSLAYRTSLVAEGRFDSMLTLRPTWEWDIAAGDLILREAGAVTSDRHARPLRFNNAVPTLNGILAANPVLHREIAGLLTT